MPKIVDTIDLGASDVLGQLQRTKLWRLFEQLPVRARTNGVRRALYAGGVVIRDAARANAPVLTGALKRSIVVQAGSPRPGGELVVKVTVAKGSFFANTRRNGRLFIRKRLNKKGSVVKLEGDFTVTPRKYAHLVEFGHAKGKGRTSAPPHPFLRPAADAMKAEAVAVMGETLKAWLEEEVANA